MCKHCRFCPSVHLQVTAGQLTEQMDMIHKYIYMYQSRNVLYFAYVHTLYICQALWAEQCMRMFQTWPDICNIAVLKACFVHELVPVTYNFVTSILTGQFRWYVSGRKRNESDTPFGSDIYFLVKQELSIVNMTCHIRFSHFLPIFQIIVISVHYTVKFCSDIS